MFEQLYLVGNTVSELLKQCPQKQMLTTPQQQDNPSNYESPAPPVHAASEL